MRLSSFIFLSCALLTLSVAVKAEPISSTVDGGYSAGKHLQCTAYLSESDQKKPGIPTLFFTQAGTGVYTTYFDHPKNEYRYFLTIDKPGVSPDFAHPHQPMVDRNLFDYYTMSNLVTCAQNALYWADDHLKHADMKIILQGHSEGTVVMINALHAMYTESKHEHVRDQIKALFLSGAVVESMADVLTYQFKGKEKKEFFKAYKKHDANAIYKNYQVSWYWINEVLHPGRNPLIQLRDLAKSKEGRALPIEIFQGLLDDNVSAEDVKKIEKQNAMNPANTKLNLHARYYNAPHGLNETTLFDINRTAEYYFNK